MDKNIIKFDDSEIEEYKFRQCKIPILIDNNLGVNKIRVHNKISLDKIDKENSNEKNPDEKKCDEKNFNEEN